MTAGRPTICGLVVLAAVGAAGTARADAIRCAAPAGVPTVAIEVAFTGETREVATVTRLDADLGDFAISTAGNPPERIAAQEGGDERLFVELADPEDVWIVLRLRLVRDVAYGRLDGVESDENPATAVAGTLSVLGVGVWPLTCEGW